MDTANTGEVPNPSKESRERDANSCIALGAGVGVLGAAGAAISGAVCPLCIVVAPALIGVGVFQRWGKRVKSFLGFRQE